MQVAALCLALLIDRWLGEPPARWHPVVWMGRYLGWAGSRIAPAANAPRRRWAPFAVSALALGQVAYSCGLSGRRRQIANVTFAFVIALVLVIILDIDRPRRGLVQVSQESMIRLQQSLEQAPQ